MEDSDSVEESIDTDSSADNLNNAPLTIESLLASTDSWSSYRLSFTSSTSNEDNEETTDPGGSQQNQGYRRMAKYSDIHWVFIFIFLVLNAISLSCSVSYLLHLVRIYPDLAHNWSIGMDVLIAINSLIIFCSIFPISKRRVLFPNRTLTYCLFCTIFNLLPAAIIFGLNYDLFTLAVFFCSIILFALLCAHRFRLSFIIIQNLEPT